MAPADSGDALGAGAALVLAAVADCAFRAGFLAAAFLAGAFFGLAFVAGAFFLTAGLAGMVIPPWLACCASAGAGNASKAAALTAANRVIFTYISVGK